MRLIVRRCIQYRLSFDALMGSSKSTQNTNNKGFFSVCVNDNPCRDGTVSSGVCSVRFFAVLLLENVSFGTFYLKFECTEALLVFPVELKNKKKWAQRRFVCVPTCTLQWCVCESLTDCAVSFRVCSGHFCADLLGDDSFGTFSKKSGCTELSEPYLSSLKKKQKSAHALYWAKNDLCAFFNRKKPLRASLHFWPWVLQTFGWGIEKMAIYREV